MDTTSKGVLLVGDAHGSDFVKWASHIGKSLDVSAIIFLGDADTMHIHGHAITDDNSWSMFMDIPCYFLLGNHDSYFTMTQCRKNGELLESNTTVDIDGIKFGVIGGIDAASHMHLYMNSHPLFRAIWTEGIETVMECRADMGTRFKDIDVLITHDAPYPIYLPAGAAGSKYLSDVIRVAKPKLSVHGHMHHFEYRNVYGCPVIGLDVLRESVDNALVHVFRDGDGELVYKVLHQADFGKLK